MNYKFSIIIAVYNTENYLKDCIDSVINQSIGFKENVQLILVDDGSTDNSKEILLEYENKYPQNILVVSQENQRQASARNNGLEYAEGKYVNFLDSDDYLSANTLEEVYCFFEEHYDFIDLVSIPVILFGRLNDHHRLNYKFKETRIIDLEKEPNNPQLHVASAFIKKDIIGNLKFDTRLISSEDALFVNKILLKKMKLGVINTPQYYYRLRYDTSSTIDTMTTKKEFYNDRLKYHFIELIEYSKESLGTVPLFIQYMLSYDLHWMLREDISFLEENEKEEFWKLLNHVVQNINQNVIMDNQNISDEIRPFFIFIKNNCECQIENQNGKILLKSRNYIIDDLNKHDLSLDIIEIKNGYLNISGCLISHFKNDSIQITINKKNNDQSSEKYFAKYVEYSHPSRKNVEYLNIPWKFCYNFDFKIPIRENETSSLTFNLIYDNITELKPKIRFNKNAGLSTSSAYFVKDNRIVLFKNNTLTIMPYSYKLMLRYEFSNLRKIIRDKKNKYVQALIVRIIYIIMYPFLKNKRIWIFSDRLEFADDNALALYDYACQQEDNINKYFVIGKDSTDYNKLKNKYSNILKFESFKHKILYLFSEKNISSFLNINYINPFYDSNIPLYSGLITKEQYFLQHGVTIGDVSVFTKKYEKNLSLLLCVSGLEKESFLEPSYNYDEEIIQVLGFPRYDKLVNEPEKKVLFIPTWRSFANKKESFLNSKYYSRLNEILNNEELHNLLDKYEYELVFKPHPELEKFIELLDIPSHVSISKDETYQELFKKSSLLITDYSSVFFDFGYLKKPIIYYQPDDDYHYDKGYFEYESMGFGDVIKKEEELISKISYYLYNNCIMEEEYKEKVDKFFKYKDKNNCKRLYEWIYQH